jgi:succinylarginine dihydrolase
MPRKGQYSINTDMLQLQVDGRRETSSIELSRLQARQGREAKEEVAERAQSYNGKGLLYQPHHSRTILYGGATQQHSNNSSLR